MEELSNAMKRVLASSFAFYLKAHNYHWNVTGPNFSEYHRFFGNLYEEVHDSIDATAEEIRKLGAFAPGSFSRFSELTLIEDEVVIPETQIMFARLRKDNQIVLNELYDAKRIASELGAAGTENYLDDRISNHEKHAWMLKSF